MSRDGSGNYSLPSGNPVVNGTVIDSTVHNTTMSDIATALSASLVADGQKTVTANLAMGGFKLTNVAAGSAANQNPIISQIQDGSLTALGSVSGTDTITAALSPAITSYATGMIVQFKPANTSTGAATIAINGLAAKAIVKGNSAALVAGDLVASVPAVIVYDGTSFVLQNPAGTLPAANGSALTNLNASNLASGTVPDGRFPATLPATSGANLTALNATNLASGTVPDARFPATLPATSGANLTALNASALASGTVPDARFPSTLPALNGSALTALNASNLSSGTVPDARFPATLPAVSGANLTALPATLPASSGVNLTALNASNLGSGTVPDARFPATLPALNGSALTALNASNLGSGTVPDARFPATLPALNGSALTALNAGNLGSGSIPDARVAESNVTQHQAALSLAASQVTSGTMATARLGSGTADSTTYLRGDNTWQTASGFTTGSFTGTLTGFSGSVTATVTWTKMNGIAWLTFPDMQGTSNTTAMTMTGLPAGIQPTGTPVIQPVSGVNNSLSALLHGSVTAGTITFSLYDDSGGTVGVLASFNNTGTKGLNRGIICYNAA